MKEQEFSSGLIGKKREKEDLKIILLLNYYKYPTLLLK